jgi:hypothetical protein
MKSLVHFAAAFLALATAVSAQSLSVEDIRAQIAAERDAPNPYAELLADPDPVVARRAMEIMLESGDVELRRLALEFGVHSPLPEVRHQALGAWLAGTPRIEFVIANAGSPESDFAELMRRLYGTAPNARGQSIWIVQLGGFNADRECFTNSGNNQCLFRHTQNGTWIFKDNVWQEVGLNDSGELVGTVVSSYPGTRANVRLTAPVP